MPGFGFGAAGSEMEERYETLKELGVGNFGVARLVRDKKTKELLAAKYIERGMTVCIKDRILFSVCCSRWLLFPVLHMRVP